MPEVPVVAAGGFYDGRGLLAALAYGAQGVAMGQQGRPHLGQQGPGGGQEPQLQRLQMHRSPIRGGPGPGHRTHFWYCPNWAS